MSAASPALVNGQRHALGYFRGGLRALLASAADLELVGEAADGEQVISLATELQPDVIVMDL